LQLDVTDQKAAREAARMAVARFGRIDVVFNNAGYGHVGAVEELAEEDWRRQLDVNLFGVINVTRAVLPIMRRQRAGHLVQMASLNAVEPLPGGAYYTASKFGVKGFSEALAAEVAHLGVKVTIVEPGPFRTRFLERESAKWASAMAEYADSVGRVREMLRGLAGRQPGDPARAAQAILQAVAAEQPPLHLPLGRMALEHIRATLQSQLDELAAWAHVGAAADFPGHAELVRQAYRAFNERDVEAAVALMAPDVAWPNLPQGGLIRGPQSVGAHWREQFRQADARIDVDEIAETDDGRVEARVRQIVRGAQGARAEDRAVHVFSFAGERIKGLEVRPPG
jgi:NAD(P)-dependent dehydrogenase (short-subunit alcohol dehydrogenase family)/ketosteroid isomerase-like protein